MEIVGVDNVILYNLRFLGGPNDAVMVKHGATNVWLSHLTLEKYGDGLIDITRSSTDVTVSWCEFKNHSKTMLAGGAPEDVIARITIHHNYFDDTVQRHPSAVFGKIHAFNNYLRRISSYGMRSRNNAQLYVERNYFESMKGDPFISDHTLPAVDPYLATAVGDKRPSTPQVPIGNLKAVGNTFVNTTGRRAESNPGGVFYPGSYYSYNAEPADSSLKSRVRNEAGWENMVLPPSARPQPK